VIDPPAAGATRLVLLRHPEPEASAAGRCYGSLDVALSPAGEAHAVRLAAALAATGAAGVYTSPRIRARRAAETIAGGLGLAAVAEPGFAELDFGELEGRSYDDIRRERPELYARWMAAPTTVRFPGGEGYEDLRRRAVAAAAAVRARHAGGTAVVVTHGGVVRALLADALAMPSAAIFALDQRYGAVNVVDWFDGRPLVRLANGAVEMADR
jgi:broad specificity phosphatase PhoE